MIFANNYRDTRYASVKIMMIRSKHIKTLKIITFHFIGCIITFLNGRSKLKYESRNTYFSARNGKYIETNKKCVVNFVYKKMVKYCRNT